jgi:hypothetical protein
MAELTVGLATLRDNLYLLGGDTPSTPEGYRLTRDGQTFLIETALTRPVVKVSEHPDQVSLAAGTNQILFPYDEKAEGITIIAEERLRTAYPGAYAYLCAMRTQLAERDRGNKTYETWYAYGRRQGLRAPHRGQLLAPIYADVPRFLLDRAPGHRFINGYAVIPRPGVLAGVWSTDEGLRALRALLESDAMALYVNLTSAPLRGGYRSYSGTYIANFGIPPVTTDDLTRLANADCNTATRWYLNAIGDSWDDFLRLCARLPGGTRCI